MERGQLGIDNRPVTIFVFENLIAQLERPHAEKLAIRARRWEAALDCWAFEVEICDYIYSLLSRFNTPVDVITWHQQGFADLLANRLWTMNVPVGTVWSDTYKRASRRLATDVSVNTVYDADPEHRFGYGFKVREFSVGNV